MEINLLSILLPLAPLVAVVLWQYVKKRTSTHSNLPLPPGPKRLPIIGNLLDLPNRSSSPWRKCRELAETYGK